MLQLNYLEGFDPLYCKPLDYISLIIVRLDYVQLNDFRLS